MDKEIRNVIKNLANKTMEKEFFHVQEQSVEEVGESDINEFNKLSNRCEQIMKILYENVPKEMYELIEEFDCKRTEIVCLETEYYFKKGVIAGLTNLKYLEEIGEQEIILL